MPVPGVSGVEPRLGTPHSCIWDNSCARRAGGETGERVNAAVAGLHRPRASRTLDEAKDRRLSACVKTHRPKARSTSGNPRRCVK